MPIPKEGIMVWIYLHSNCAMGMDNPGQARRDIIHDT